MGAETGVEFVGGPLDGQRHVLQSTPEVWSDAGGHELVKWTDEHGDDGERIALVRPMRPVYRRRVNLDADGPRYLYDFMHTEPTGDAEKWPRWMAAPLDPTYRAAMGDQP